MFYVTYGGSYIAGVTSLWDVWERGSGIAGFSGTFRNSWFEGTNSRGLCLHHKEKHVCAWFSGGVHLARGAVPIAVFDKYSCIPPKPRNVFRASLGTAPDVHNLDVYTCFNRPLNVHGG